MSFYENNRAGNAVLSAFPWKILQKTAIKKSLPALLCEEYREALAVMW